MNVKIKWLVCYGGGCGPNTWDAEITVEADNIRQALEKAEKQLQGENCWIASIEQES